MSVCINNIERRWFWEISHYSKESARDRYHGNHEIITNSEQLAQNQQFNNVFMGFKT